MSLTEKLILPSGYEVVARMKLDQDLEVASRIHIMPMGFEKERIYNPAKQLKADEVILISHIDNAKEFDLCYEKVEEELLRSGIAPSIKKCNIFDVYDSLRAINEVIADHQEDEVYVNVSAGSKITAIAGMIACMISGATPYYVRVTDYSGDSPSEVVDINPLPRYQIDPPTPDQIAVLEHLNDDGPSTKGELIEFGEKAGLDFLSDFTGKEKAKYRRLDRHIIKPLTASGFIDIRRDGRKKIVAITEAGERAWKAFKHLIKEENLEDQENQYALP